MLDERIARNFIFQILILLAKKFNGLKAALFIARNVMGKFKIPRRSAKAKGLTTQCDKK